MFYFPALLLACCVGTVWGVRPPKLDVGKEVIIRISEQKSFQLRCEGSQNVFWNWSSLLESNYAEIEDDEQENEDYPFVSTLLVNEAYAGDTGFYRCYYADATNLVTDNDNVASTYVYVHNESIFVDPSYKSVTMTTRQKLVLDCRTTLPDVTTETVQLMKDEDDVTGKFQWDNKIGFVRTNLAVHDTGLYKCLFKPTGENQLFHVIINPSQAQLQPPTIELGPHEHFVVGDPFQLKCKFYVPHEIDGTKLKWSYPNYGAGYSEVKSEEVGEGMKILFNTLHVPRASKADSGIYKCTATTSLHPETSDTEDILVQDEVKPYVNISGSPPTIPVNKSDQMRWRETVHSFPHNLRIVYTNWQGQVLTKKDRIDIEFEEDTLVSWLRISNITSDDFGNYTLTATTTDGAAKANKTVTIEVKSGPSVNMSAVPSYALPGSTFAISCSAQGFPVPAIKWDFQSCPNGLQTCVPTGGDVFGDESVVYPAPGNLVQSNTTLKAPSSGLVRCLANNSLDTDSTAFSVSLSDIDGLHVLRHTGLTIITDLGSPATSTSTSINTINVTTNDDFRLLCGGNKLHYKAVTLKPPRHGIEVHQNESDYSFLRLVSMESVTKALAGEYSCRAERYDGTIDIKNATINVFEETMVTFLEDSNMAKNETVEVKEDSPFFINCTVTGRPAPIIQWKKDGKPLSENSTFFDGNTAFLTDEKQRLHLHYVFKKHLGVYTCTAVNRLNTVTGSLTLAEPVLSRAAKAGLTVAVISIAILIITVVILFRRVKRERKFKKSFRKNALYLFEQGNIGQLNPDCAADEQAELLPYGQEWEVPRDQITLGKQLGSGAFGRVVKASVTGLEGPAATTVAIKMCKSQADPSQVHALTLELKIMIHLGKHLNIVNLMGAKTVDIGRGELWILVEYCRFGNLLVFMHRHRRNFINQIDPATGRIDPTRMTSDTGSIISPLSPGSRSSQHVYSASPNSPIALSQPPPGRHASFGRQQVHNPLYNAAVTNPSGGGVFFGPNSTVDTATSDVGESYDSSGNTLDTTTSLSSDGRAHNTYYTSTLGSTASHAPLSPTESSGLVDSHGNSFLHEVGSVPGVNAPFTTTDLVCWAWQVAHGMEYLASRKVLHGDLAARNLLLADDNVVKISDFGLSREMYKKDVYMKKGDDLMPIKWISLEAIRDRIFSVQSDVWAFGVTLWEIFSLGSTPYPGIEVNKDFLQLLEDGYRMSCPKYANQEIYNLLLECWDADPRNRPSFRQALRNLDELMQPDIKGEYLSMNDQYMRMNEERFKEQTDYLNMLTPPDYENMTNRAIDDDVKPHYVNMEVAGGSRRDTVGQASIQSPETVNYSNIKTVTPAPTPPTNHYLPMSSTRGSQTPENDIFSPCPSEDPRFTFPHEENTPSAGVPSKDNDADAKRISGTENTTLIMNGQNA